MEHSSQLAAVPFQGHERRGGDRRRRPTPLLSRYMLLGGRREGDRRLVGSANQYVDRYEVWLAAALVAIAALSALDAIFTLQYLQKGGTEANPIMAAVIEWGPRPFLLVKSGITSLGLLVLCVHKNFRLVKPVIGALLGAYASLLCYHLYLVATVR